jgi:hypothetical protein
MSTIVRIGDHQLTAQVVCQHLSTSQFLPQLLREIVIDEALAEWEASTQPQLAESETRVEGCNFVGGELAIAQGGNDPALIAIAARNFKIQQFKEDIWGHKLGSHYLSRKPQLDQIICSVMQVKDEETAQELFFRVQSGAKSFGELAFKYSQGVQARDGGKLGPVTIATLHPEISRQITHLQPGQLSPLFTIDPFYMFVRLEELVPAQFDDNLRQVLLDELFEKWLQDRIASEIGLLSVQTNFISSDFMSDERSFREEPATRKVGGEEAQIPQQNAIPPDFNREQFNSERGDTGLLLSQLDNFLMAPPSPNPVIPASPSTPVSAPPLSASPSIHPVSAPPLSASPSIHPVSAPPLSAPKQSFPKSSSRLSSTDIEDLDRESYRQKWLLAVLMTITALIAGVSVCNYMDASFKEIAPVNSTTQVK